MISFTSTIATTDAHSRDPSGKLCVGIRRGVHARFASSERHGLIVTFGEKVQQIRVCLREMRNLRQVLAVLWPLSESTLELLESIRPESKHL